VRSEVQRQNDVLIVPNVALRWYPMSASEVAPDARSSWKPVEPQQSPDAGAQKPARQHKDQSTTRPRERKATIWIKEGQFVRPVEVKAGFSDGTRTAISSDQLKEGAEVVTGEISGETTPTADTSQKNPFIPQMPSRRGR